MDQTVEKSTGRNNDGIGRKPPAFLRLHTDDSAAVGKNLADPFEDPFNVGVPTNFCGDP
jgi:hypothetical protein